jgi:hypothetical protein
MYNRYLRRSISGGVTPRITWRAACECIKARPIFPEENGNDVRLLSPEDGRLNYGRRSINAFSGSCR